MRSRSERRSSPLRRMRTGTPGWQQQPRRERYDSPENDVFERLSSHRPGRRVAAFLHRPRSASSPRLASGRCRFSGQPRGGRYCRARYYHPGLQRFITEDPSGFVDGWNLYAYVGNNPLSFRDPHGLFIDPVITTVTIVTFGTLIGLIVGGDQSPRPPAKCLSKEDECWEKCKHLLPSPSRDRQASEFRKCWRECMGRL